MLKRLFIENYKNTNNNDVRNSYGKVAGVFGIVTNLILGIMKVIIGVISNSVSIMADATNNILDMISSLLTVIGFKLSSKKADKYHPYGYARYEYIFAFIIALITFNMGIIFAKESIIKIIQNDGINISFITYLILSISILLKVIQMFVYLDFSKSINSQALKASAVDTRNDILTTSAILVSMIIMNIFNINIDGFLGLFISLFILYSSYKMIREVIEPLIGIVPTKEQVNEIKKKLLSYDCVLGFHDLIIHNYGVGNDFAIVHIELDSKINMLDAHELIDEIENDFKDELGIDLTVHIDPVIVGNKKIDKLKNEVIKKLGLLDKSLRINDFRIIESSRRVKVLFDCVVPFDKNYRSKYLENYLNNNIDGNCTFIIEINRPYC